MSGAIVILGGFLTPASLYAGLADTLSTLSDQPVPIVPTLGVDWLPSVVQAGWTIILRKLDRSVRSAASGSQGQVTLICHSAGGLIARLYVSGGPILGRDNGGHGLVERLVTLGTPHYNSHRRRVHGGMLAHFANERAPGAFASPAVSYVSVAGSSLRGNRHGSFRDRHTYTFYRRLGGAGNVWGDGLIPVSSARLESAQQITLDGVSHHTSYGSTWFGSPQVIEQWWRATHHEAQPALAATQDAHPDPLPQHRATSGPISPAVVACPTLPIPRRLRARLDCTQVLPCDSRRWRYTYTQYLLNHNAWGYLDDK